MSNEYFKFRQFTVRQERCAMKVGTDGTLLGAWADLPGNIGITDAAGVVRKARILDIGTGTGLIAMMMAQRFPEARVTAIDIDPQAVAQARENVMESPFSERIEVLEGDINRFQDSDGFDAIVCNPPYFVDSLKCPDNEQRTMARHTVNLTYAGLMQAVSGLLRPEGIFSLVIPTDSRSQLEAEARIAGFFLTRICMVKTTPKKHPKRQLIEIRKYPINELIISEGIIEIEPNLRSDWYKELTADFYIK